MIYLSLVFAILVGYIIGLMQKGIRIYINEDSQEAPKEYNQSTGIVEYQKYHDETEGRNKF